jgi:hypothetical protein
MSDQPERRPLPEWVPRWVARRLGRGRLLRRTTHDTLQLRDTIGWERYTLEPYMVFGP